MFPNIQNIKSIKFLPDFDSSEVANMVYMFLGCSIEYIDMKYLDTSNLLYLNGFMNSSNYIRSIHISNFNISKTICMEYMFIDNYYLNEIDLSSFDTSEVEYCSGMFHDIQENCIIIISTISYGIISTKILQKVQ